MSTMTGREMLETEVRENCRLRTEGETTWVEYESLIDLLSIMATRVGATVMKRDPQ